MDKSSWRPESRKEIAHSRASHDMATAVLRSRMFESDKGESGDMHPDTIHESLIRSRRMLTSSLSFSRVSVSKLRRKRESSSVFSSPFKILSAFDASPYAIRNVNDLDSRFFFFASRS